MSAFKSYQKFITRPKTDPLGAPVTRPDGTQIMEKIEVPRWSTEATVNFLRVKGGDLVQSAVRDGWHINLIDFVQHQHRLPNMAECEDLVLDFQKIEAATPHSTKRSEILKTRKRLAAELSAPLSLKATG